LTVPHPGPDHAATASTQEPGPAMSPQRLTRGADVVRVALLSGAAGWLVAGDPSAALKALLVLPPAVLGRVVHIHPAFDLLFSFALAVEATASGLGAYDSVSWGDTLPHLVLPVLSAAAQPSAAPTARFRLGAAVVSAASVLALGALWELVEWATDSAFGTNYSEGYRDTLVDLLADAVAAIGGGVLVAVWLGAGARGPGLA
jgi:hypothetical protein